MKGANKGSQLLDFSIFDCWTVQCNAKRWGRTKNKQLFGNKNAIKTCIEYTIQAKTRTKKIKKAFTRHKGWPVIMNTFLYKINSEHWIAVVVVTVNHCCCFLHIIIRLNFITNVASNACCSYPEIAIDRKAELYEMNMAILKYPFVDSYLYLSVFVQCLIGSQGLFSHSRKCSRKNSQDKSPQFRFCLSDMNFERIAHTNEASIWVPSLDYIYYYYYR